KLIGRRRRKQAPDEPNPDSGLRILIVTDAWQPQVNGVVRTLEFLGDHLSRMGNTVRYITPDMFRSVPMPTYPEIRLALWPTRRVASIINRFQPDAIHIATEGPLGWAARRFCVRREHPFTTSLHTRFPEYVNARTRLPVSWGYAYLRRFHRPASAVMVATPSLREELAAMGFRNLRIWSRGVDLSRFRPATPQEREAFEYKRPVWLYVGRVAVEKNVEAFLSLDLEGTKVVVGDGPQRGALAARYPEAVFLGPRFGEALAEIYAASDVFVFPSRTDTFGLVNVEALASGVPVAAYPVQGPQDIIGNSGVGAVSEDLGEACRLALGCATPEACRAHAERFSWEACTRQFLTNLDLPGYDETYWEESAEIPD
ncbi:MAG: glycosyltransferase family 4 protein, partial [Alphaproteobacteria bacterium]